MKRIVCFLLVLVLTLSLAPVAFAGYSPSVQRQAYPSAVSRADLFGVGKGSIVIYDDWDLESEDWDVIHEVPYSELILHSANRMSKDAMEGYRKLAAAKTIPEICENFEDVLAETDPDARVSDMVVRDVFEFELLGKSLDALEDEETNFIIVAFEYNIEEDDTFVCLQYIDGKWVAIEPESVKLADGLVALRLKNDGALAFVVENDYAIYKKPAGNR